METLNARDAASHRTAVSEERSVSMRNAVVIERFEAESLEGDSDKRNVSKMVSVRKKLHA